MEARAHQHAAQRPVAPAQPGMRQAVERDLDPHAGQPGPQGHPQQQARNELRQPAHQHVAGVEAEVGERGHLTRRVVDAVEGPQRGAGVHGAVRPVEDAVHHHRGHEELRPPGQVAEQAQLQERRVRGHQPVQEPVQRPGDQEGVDAPHVEHGVGGVGAQLGGGDAPEPAPAEAQPRADRQRGQRRPARCPAPAATATPIARGPARRARSAGLRPSRSVKGRAESSRIPRRPAPIEGAERVSLRLARREMSTEKHHEVQLFGGF